MRKVILFMQVFCLLCFSKGVLGQANSANYTFSAINNGSLTDMSTGTTQLVAASSDIVTSSVTPLPFSIIFMGGAYDNFVASSDGAMKLGNSTMNTTGVGTVNDLTPTTVYPVIAPFWDDLATNSTGKVHYKVIGSAPNRVLVVEWLNMEIRFASTTADGTYQARLYEGTGVIEFVYGAMAVGAGQTTAVTASIGFSAGNTANTFSSVTSLTSPVVNTTTDENNLVNVATAGAIVGLNSTANGSRVSFKWTPPAAPIAPSTLTFSNIGLNKMDLNWADNSSDEAGFAILVSTDGINYSPAGFVAANTTTYTVTGLTASTTYYWRVVSFSEGALSSPATATQATVNASPMSGIYTINNTQPTAGTNFNNFTDAFEVINGNGISGAVTFNVFAGQTFNEILVPLTATGTATNTITFNKFGSGANPIVQRTDAGTLVTSTMGGQGDAIITIQGGDYITFDGIDVNATTATIEYGYLLRKATAINGCKYVVIKNANVTMTKPSTGTPYVTGIYASNLDASSLVSSATGVTVTSTGGRHENVTITGNTISNVFYGIQLRAYAHTTAPYNFYDSAFVVGAAGTNNGNTINNFGGFSTTVNYGIYVLQHKAANISYNTINNTDNGGVNATGTTYGIFMSTGTTSAFTAKNNNISLTTGYASGSLYGIYNSAATGNLFINDNTISLSSASTITGTVGFVYNAGATDAATTIVEIKNNLFATNGLSAPASQFSTMYLIYNSVTNAAVNTIQNNSTIAPFNVTGGTSSITIYGYYNLGAPTGTEIFANNNFSNITAPYNFYGYYSSTTAAHRRNIFGNTISSVVAVGSTVYGIYKATGISNIYNNKIADITTNATTSSLYGIYLSSGVKDSIYNNIIGDLKAPTSATASNAIVGIYSTSTSTTSTIGIYYNTISLSATSGGSNFGTTGFYLSGSTTASTATADVRNNIIVNNSTSNGTGFTVAYRRSTTALDNFAATSNNNLLLSSGLFFYDGTNQEATLAGYKTRVSPRESLSINESPNFVSTTPIDLTYLHIDPTSATQIESGGTPITNITVDIDGNTRNAIKPDIGADEFAGVPADFTAPAINFTTLASSCSNGNRVVANVNIQDGSGVPTTGALVPRIYYRKGTGTWYSQPGTLTSGTGNNGTWSFNIIASDMGGVAFGNIISYYLIAQDIASTPNIASNTAGVVATNVNTVSSHPSTPASYSVGQSLNGTYTVGASGTFSTLTSAVAVYNGCPVSGPVVFSLIDAIYGAEMFPISIDSNTNASVTNTLTIKPALGNTVNLSASAAGIIKINGGDFITIDGSNNGTKSRDLTIENTLNTASSVIWVAATGTGAKNNTIKNVVVKGGSATVSGIYGIVAASSTSIATGAAGNDYLTIKNDSISNVFQGINVTGVTGGLINGLVIDSSSIGSTDALSSVSGKGISVGYAAAPIISNNNISNIITSTSVSNVGIEVSTGVADAKIVANKIQNVHSTSTSGYGAYGINFAGAATNTLVANNFISGIKTANYSTTSTTFNAFGIRITAGTNYKIYHNSINMVDNITSGTNAGMSANAIVTAAITGLDVRNNIFNNAQTFATTGSSVYNVYLAAAVAAPLVINNNDYFGTTTTNTTYRVGYSTTNKNTFADWQAFTTQDANSVSVDPLFVSTDDLHLQPTSTLVNIGVGIPEVTKDIDGDVRNASTPAIGADEQPPVAGLDILVSSLAAPIVTQGCYTSTDSIKVAINNNSLTTLDFSVNPVTVTVNVTGAASGTYSKVVNTGTLASTGVLVVSVQSPFDMSATGVYTFNIVASLTGDVNTSNNTINGITRTKVALTSGTIKVTPDQYCITGGTPVLSATGAAGYNSLQWQTSTTSGTGFGNITSATTNPYTVASAITQTTYYLLTATCGTNTVVSVEDTATLNSPAVTGTTPNYTCGTGTVTLGATGSVGSILNWYAASSGGSPLGTGAVFTTPSISTTTTYYVGASSGGGSTGNLGKTAYGGADGFNTGTASYLIFDAFTAFNLNSVVIYPYGPSAGAGTITLSLSNSAGTILQSYTVNVNASTTATPLVVPLNFNIIPGINYRLGPTAFTGSATGMFRDLTSGIFPYTLPGVASITTTSLGAGYYYYCYNWTVSTGCESPRTAVVATVDNTPGCSTVPVSLLNFRGERQGANNLLSWATVTELNNAGFELQRSADGINFSKLAFIESKASNGNSNGNLNYSLTDTKSLISGSYYRLKQIDKDGKSTLSQIVFIKGAKVSKLELVSVYPNPTVNTLNISLVSPKADNVTFIVSDITGKVITKQTNTIVNGDNIIKLNVSTLANGTYTIKAICADGCQTAISKFVKQ